jgi:nucleoside-triphosphatase
VHLQEFERMALPELERRDADLLVIDEIGKMECASERFRHAVEQALDAPGLVLATLGIGHLPFLKKVRERPDVELITITERNRDGLVAELCKRIVKEHPVVTTADRSR